jgi:ribosomal protein S18 acetylase RimI-like enzyme
MSYILRHATSNDEADVVALWRECDLVASYNNPSFDFQFALTGPSSAVLLAVAEDQSIAGSVMVGHDGHRGWLYYVAAAARTRGLGVGRQMVEAGEDWLREREVKKVQLLVRETNTKVVSFYEHLNYETTPRTIMAKWL